MVKFKVLNPCLELRRAGVSEVTIHHGNLIKDTIYFETSMYGIKNNCVVYKGNYQLIDETNTIEIQHQESKAMHQFNVVNPDALTINEVKTICEEMGGLKALFINGRYYENK